MEEDISQSSPGGAEVIKEEVTEVNNSIEERLNELKDDLELKESEIEEDKIELDNRMKSADKSKGNIKDLEKSGADIDKVVDEYGKAYDDNQIKKSDIQSYIDYKGPIIENQLTPEMREKIKGERKKVDKEIIDLIEKVKTLKEKIKSDISQKITAEETLSLRDTEFNDLITRKVEIEKEIKELNDLKNWIETLEDEKKLYNIRYMYFLILDMEVDLEELGDKLVEQDALHESLIQSWLNLANAKVVLREKEIQLNKHQDELKITEKNFEEAKKNRETEIFDLISRISDP